MQKNVNASKKQNGALRETKFYTCEICKQYHLGVIHAVSKNYDVEIPYRISAGDSTCEFAIFKSKG